MKVSRLISLIVPILLAAAWLVSGEGAADLNESSPSNKRSDEDYRKIYQAVLKSVDKTGMVDYRSLKRNRADLDRFADLLDTLTKATYESWDEQEKVSFWLNAYNGLTLLAIVDHYPIQSSFLKSFRFPENSIRQISGVWDSITFPVMGEPTTLDQIEHQILRKEFDEPRIHVALVCAAMGCPPLRNEPYEGVRLGEQLDDQSRRFLENPEKFRIDRSSNTIYLSKIFDWFGDDFMNRYPGERSGSDLGESSVLEFVSRYIPPDDVKYLRSGNYRVKYLDYDWSLNEQSND
jgi:hypothetical protein